MKMYQLFKRISFQVSSDKALNRQIIVPAVIELKKRLTKFVFREGSFSAWVADEPDDLQVSFPEPTMASCSLRINLEMRDTIYDGSASRFSQFELSIFANRIKALEFEMDGLVLEMRN